MPVLQKVLLFMETERGRSWGTQIPAPHPDLYHEGHTELIWKTAAGTKAQVSVPLNLMLLPEENFYSPFIVGFLDFICNKR